MATHDQPITGTVIQQVHGHSYQNISRSDHARVHVGDVHEYEDPLKHLPFASNALFNAFHRAHDSDCLPGTRQDALEEMYKWVDGDEKSCIFWLIGWPGTGKSAIARTVARHYHAEGRLAASFFFTRGGGDCSHAGLFATSIARQLADNKALGVQQLIRGSLKEHSQIAKQTLQDQWTQLVVQPLSRYERRGNARTFLIVIDALDECEEGDSIGILLRLLPQVGACKNIRVRILVTSRPETPIRHGFDQMGAAVYQGFVLHRMPTEVSDRDIRIYLKHHFSSIALQRHLPNGWPGEQVLETMVQRAQGLFMWATTACKFVRDGKRFAEKRLQTLLDRSASTGSEPERHLDAIYNTILHASVPDTYSEEEKNEAYYYLRLILGSIVVSFSALSVHSLSKLLGLTSEDTSETIAELHSVLDIPDASSHPLRLHHDSFRSFLLDESRCRERNLVVNELQSHTVLAMACMELMSSILKRDICSQREARTLVSDVDQGFIQQRFPPEVQYACLYWVSHTVKSGQLLLDDGHVHQFLRKHLLHWMEAMGWIDRIPDATSLLAMLESSSKDQASTSLCALAQEAKEFLVYAGQTIEQAPLQVYEIARSYKPTNDAATGIITQMAYPYEISRKPVESSVDATTWQSSIDSRMSTVPGQQTLTPSTSIARGPLSDSVEEPVTEPAADLRSLNSFSSRVELGTHGRLVGVDVFARDVVQHLDPDLSDVIHAQGDVLDAVQDALHVYSYSLERRVGHFKLSTERRAARFVRQQCHDIAKKVVGQIIHAQSSDSETQLLEPGFFTEPENVRAWMDDPTAVQNTSGDSGAATDIWGSSAARTIEIDPYNNLIERMREFLSDSREFEWLTKRIQVAAGTTGGTSLRAVTRGLLHGFKNLPTTPETLKMRLSVDWNLGEFLSRNYTGSVQLARIICVNFDGLGFEANTVGEYVTQIWPTIGPQLLHMLEDCWRLANDGTSHGTLKRTIHRSEATISSLNSLWQVEIEGPLFTMVEIGEMLAWLGCVLRTPYPPNRHELVKPSLTQVYDHGQSQICAAFEINFRIGECPHDSDAGGCWLQLFRECSVAEGFPVSNREDEAGIRIAFAMMSELGGFDRVTDYAGQLVLKGYGTLFIPVRKTCTSIVWHLVTKANGRRVSFNALSQFAERANRSVCMYDLNHSRHYLGWVSSASQHAGTEDGEYDQIPDVHLDRPGPGLVLSGVSISMSKIFGLSANFTAGKKDQGIRSSSAESSYCDIVEKMTKMHVLLYDHKNGRGWLVDASSALLHLLRYHVAHYRPICENGAFKLDQFQYANPSGGRKTARDVLLDSEVRRTVLIKDTVQSSTSQLSGSSNTESSGKTTWTIEDRVRDLWGILEQMYDTWKAKKNADGVHLDRFSSKVEGWRFQDIVEHELDMETVVADLDSSADDWLRLIREINAVVLIGNDLGELIKPASDVCHGWRSVPRNRFCVVVPVSRLRSIARKHGNPETSPAKLAKDVFWPILEHPFECECNKHGSKRRLPCNRSQALGSNGILKGDVKNDFLKSTEYGDGAVIFGGRKLRKLASSRGFPRIQADGTTWLDRWRERLRMGNRMI